MSDTTKAQFVFLLKNRFKPGTPIEARDLFAERREQSQSILAAINQSGQHAVLYGERGVGKTSMANMLRFLLKTPGWTQLVPTTNCARSDTFSSLWGRLFAVLHEQMEKNEIKLRTSLVRPLRLASEGYCDQINMEMVRRVLTAVAEKAALVVLIDEFDLLTDPETRGAIADSIKYFSDRASPFTVMLVGVADDVHSLIADHRSIERCLIQVRMPRMSRDELEDLVRTCLDKTKDGVSGAPMSIEDAAVQEISRLSVGLPHYAHLLGLYSGIQAIESSSLIVRQPHVSMAIGPSIENSHQTVQDAYLRATESSQSTARYSEVLLACAMSETNPQGFFSPSDVRNPLSRIQKRDAKIENFTRHLHAFCGDESGQVLEVRTFRNRPQFRFINPLMQPFALLNGLRSKMITEEDLKQTKAPGEQLRLF